MQTIQAQLAALAVTDTLKHASVPGTLTNIPWQVTVGTWSEAAGWSPSSFSANPPTGTRSGLYLNTGEQSGDHAVGLKKTTGSLATSERQFEVWMCSAMGAKASGYQLAVITNKGSNGKVRYVLRRFIEGEGKTLFETNEEQAFNENDSFFLARVGSALLIYYRSGEGTPTLIGGAIDSTFTKGFVGFGGNGSNPRLINFTVGALTIAAEVERFRNMQASSSNAVLCGVGTCNRNEDVTLMALVRLNAKPAGGFTYSLIQLEINGARGFCIKIKENGQLECNWLESGEEGKQTVSTTPSLKYIFDNHWKIVVVRKEVGAKKADFGIYDLQTREWQWEEGSEGPVSKSETPTTLRLGSSNGFNNLKGDYAAAFCSPVMSRASIEALVKNESLIDWRGSASGLWFLNKETVGTKLEDETGNGANQTNTSSGGSVVSEAPPIPYYVPVVNYTRTLIGAVTRFIKRWTFWGGAVRRF